MGLLAVLAIRELRTAIEERRMQADEDEDR
jgi:hypothetical protein